MEEFESIYREYLPKIYRFVAWRVDIKAECEDIVSDIFTKLYEQHKKGRLTEINNLNAWIYKVSINQITDHYRQMGNINSARIDNLELESTDIAIEEGYALEEEFRLLSREVNKLPEKQQLCFRLKYIEDFSNVEIAELLEISEKTVHSNIKVALDKLRAALK